MLRAYKVQLEPNNIKISKMKMNCGASRWVPFTEERKAKMRKPRSEAAKENMRKPKSEEHKAKLRESYLKRKLKMDSVS